MRKKDAGKRKKIRHSPSWYYGISANTTSFASKNIRESIIFFMHNTTLASSSRVIKNNTHACELEAVCY